MGWASSLLGWWDPHWWPCHSLVTKSVHGIFLALRLLQCHIPACPSHEGPRQGPGGDARVGASPNPLVIGQDWVTTGHHMGDRTQQTLP